ncbi:ABC transporter permease subunit, partial [Enterococcus faecalis]|uniref:ABC transporter permease subunit n=1 Tax=Enterococcus faecalis TaxID=1351 RepID=UPI003CC63F4A
MDLATISSIITQTFVYATPLILTALGGTLSERSGVVNVGMEGIMVMGAFSSVDFNLTYSDTIGAATPWIACLVGCVVGIV